MNCSYYKKKNRISFLCSADITKLKQKFDLIEYNGVTVYTKNITNFKNKKFIRFSGNLNLFLYKYKVNGSLYKHNIPDNCFGSKNINSEIYFYYKKICVNELKNSVNNILYFQSDSYIINYTDANNTLQNASFEGTRIYRDCNDLGLSYEDYENNNVKLELSYRCNNSNDNSLNENDGTVNGAIWNYTGHNVNDKGCYEFNGLNEFIKIGTDISSLNLQTFTIQAWIRKISSGGTHTILSNNPNQAWVDGKGYSLVVLANNSVRLYVGDASGSWSYVTSSNAISLNVWTYITASWNGTTDTGFIYINGNLENEKDYGSLVIDYTSPADVFIGVDEDSLEIGRNYFNGSIDEVYIYEKILSGYEINQTYYDSLFFYGKGNTTYNITLSGSLINISLNKTRNGTVNIYVNDTNECNLTLDNNFCDIVGSYIHKINITLEFVNISGTANVNEIILYDSTDIFYNCTCIGCVECVSTLNSNCSYINLTESITNLNENCIVINNLTSKTFNCLNNFINGSNFIQNGIYINNSYNISILNCNVSNFQNGLLIQNSTVNEITNNVFCNNWNYDVVDYEQNQYGNNNTGTLLLNFADVGLKSQTTYQCSVLGCVTDSTTVIIYIVLLLLLISVGLLLNDVIVFFMFGFSLIMISTKINTLCDFSFFWIIAVAGGIYFIFLSLNEYIQNKNG